MLVGIEAVRGLDDAGEQRCLRDRHALDVVTEVPLRRLLHPIGPIAEPDRVQVLLEDEPLGVGALELNGEARLLDLPLDVLLGTEECVLHVLLGDGRAALGDLAGSGRLARSAEDALGVDPVVLPEAFVFDRHHGVLEDPRNLVEWEGLPPFLAGQLSDEGAVGGEDLSAVARGRCVDGGELAPLEAAGAHDETRGEQRGRPAVGSGGDRHRRPFLCPVGPIWWHHGRPPPPRPDAKVSAGFRPDVVRVDVVRGGRATVLPSDAHSAGHHAGTRVRRAVGSRVLGSRTTPTSPVAPRRRNSSGRS